MTIRTKWQFVGGTGIIVHEELVGEYYTDILNAAAAFAGALCERQAVACVDVYNTPGSLSGSVDANGKWMSRPVGADTSPTPEATPTELPSSAPDVLNIEAIILDLAHDCLASALTNMLDIIATRKARIGG